MSQMPLRAIRTSSSNYDIMVGLDPSLRYLFIAKNNDNVEDKSKSTKINLRQDYYDQLEKGKAAVILLET
jgi:hypothetical protein